MALEMGQDFLEEYSLTGLSSIIAAALVKAGKSNPRVRKILFSKTIQKVCQIAVEAGLAPSDLCEAAMTILEISHKETTRLREELERKNRAQVKIEEEKMMMESDGEGS